MEPCKVVPKAFHEGIQEMIHRTLEDGRERGFFILKRGDRLSRSGIQKGTKTRIGLRMFNPLNVFGKPIATVHSHPNVAGDKLMSLQDASMLLDGDLSFIGIAFRDRGEDRLAIFSGRGFDNLRAAIEDVAARKPGFDSMPSERKLAVSVTGLNKRLQQCEVAL